MNFVIAHVLTKLQMKEARAAIYKPSQRLSENPTQSVKAAFKNSFVDVNYTIKQLGFVDEINSQVSKRDVNLILEYAKEELKLYKKIGNYYIKWSWNWTTDHTIILLILIELVMKF